MIVTLLVEQESAVLRHVDERLPTMLRGEFKKMLAAARRPQGDPHEATAKCGGGASSGAKGSHAAPCGIDLGVCVQANTEEGVQPEKPHRLPSRSARPVQGGVFSSAFSR